MATGALVAGSADLIFLFCTLPFSPSLKLMPYEKAAPIHLSLIPLMKRNFVFIGIMTKNKLAVL